MIADIGLIGLGVMGANLALNIAEKGYKIAVFNRTEGRTWQFLKEAGHLQERIIACTDLLSLVKQISTPRAIILMLPAGEAVDAQIRLLQNMLSPHDLLIDGGNADFHDTRQRFAQLQKSCLHFIGMGVSGGREGARHGPSIMIGGEQKAWQRVEPVLKGISARHNTEPCSAWLGPDGAGHFVKTIHNGIEYADMQMIAEIYGILRDGAGFSPSHIADIFVKWNTGCLNSYLTGITAKVLATQDLETGKPLVDMILDHAGQKGTGKWCSIEAQKLGVPSTCIEAALAARAVSALGHERTLAEKIYPKLLRSTLFESKETLIPYLETALFAGKILAYTQGFSIMHTASKTFSWKLPLDVVARIWRAGCIIRSPLLEKIAEAFSRHDVVNLLTTPEFVHIMQQCHPALRHIVGIAVQAELPVPALSAALSYFDSYRQGRSVANLIQAQRDFFGAHGFKRIDLQGNHHGPWKEESASA